MASSSLRTSARIAAARAKGDGFVFHIAATGDSGPVAPAARTMRAAMHDRGRVLLGPAREGNVYRNRVEAGPSPRKTFFV